MSKRKSAHGLLGLRVSKSDVEKKRPMSMGPGRTPPLRKTGMSQSASSISVLKDVGPAATPKLEHVVADRVASSPRGRRPPTRRGRGKSQAVVRAENAPQTMVKNAAPRPKYDPLGPPPAAKPAPRSPGKAAAPDTAALPPPISAATAEAARIEEEKRKTKVQTVGTKKVMRIFLDNAGTTSKMLPVMLPCTFQDLAATVGKKIRMEDTSSWFIHEVNGTKAVRILPMEDDVSQVMDSWSSDTFKFVFKPPESGLPVPKPKPKPQIDPIAAAAAAAGNKSLRKTTIPSTPPPKPNIPQPIAPQAAAIPAPIATIPPPIQKPAAVAPPEPVAPPKPVVPPEPIAPPEPVAPPKPVTPPTPVPEPVAPPKPVAPPDPVPDPDQAASTARRRPPQPRRVTTPAQVEAAPVPAPISAQSDSSVARSGTMSGGLPQPNRFVITQSGSPLLGLRSESSPSLNGSPQPVVDTSPSTQPTPAAQPAASSGSPVSADANGVPGRGRGRGRGGPRGRGRMRGAPTRGRGRPQSMFAPGSAAVAKEDQVAPREEQPSPRRRVPPQKESPADPRAAERQNLLEAARLAALGGGASASAEQASTPPAAEQPKQTPKETPASQPVQATPAAQPLQREAPSAQKEEPPAAEEQGSGPSTPPSSWSVGDVGEWLKSINLHQLVEVFSENEISGPELLELTMDEIKEDLEVTKLGTRKALWRAIQSLNG